MPNSISQGRVLPLLLIGVALASAAAGFLVARSADPPALEQAVGTASVLRTYPQPRVIADFALVDRTGQSYNLDRWKGQANLLFFGFTHCPDICPGTLGLLSEVRSALQQRGIGADRLAVHFISVDPERDTPEMLARYVGHFDNSFHAATGPHPQLAALTRQLGILYSVAGHEPGDRAYGVDHSASVLLINQEGRLAGAFPAPLDADAMIEALASWLADAS